MTDEDRTADLLIEWEEGHERGTDRSAEELCRDCPHLAPEVARRIHALKATSWLAKGGDHEPPPEPDGPERPPDAPLAGRYRLDSKLGEGGFAEVWKGYDLELRRAVAVKRPKAGRTAAPDHFVAEARKMAGLKHPGVVPVFDVGRDGGAWFIVSELVEGGSLADRIATSRPARHDAVRTVAEVADTLDYAHRRGFVHRDIKPGNILIDHHGRALLTDFGIARSPGDDAGDAVSFGTLAYMAPEQIEGKTTDHRADIYGLGVVLYELLTGHRPHEANDPVELRRQIVGGPLPVISDTAGVPTWWAGVCLKCLARNPDDRYQDAAALAADLRSTSGVRPLFRRRAFLVSGVAALFGVVGAAGWRNRSGRRAAEADGPSVGAVRSWERVGVIGNGVLQAPVGVAWDRDGNLLVTNGGSGRVSVLDRAGECVREFGEPGRQAHQLRHPHYVCVTSAGTIVVGDHGNDRILTFRPDGSWLSSLGGSGGDPGEFRHPEGVAADGGTLFVSDSHNHRIRVYSLDGELVRQFGTAGTAAGQLRNPSGIALGRDRIFVADTLNRRVQVFDLDGRFLRCFGGPGVEPQGVSVMPDGRLLVTDTLNRCVQAFDPDGKHLGRLPDLPGRSVRPLGVATAPDGLVAVANYARHEVCLYRATGASSAAD